ncbi:ASCH domain-containing protein [Roseiconus nitratireducens]|nr:ASCH domain-containing protein [Roseiconus nitratireducens]
MCQSLIALVRQGKKTGTCSALREYQRDPMPQVGRVDIALNWDGTPALAIEITDVSVHRFSEVSEDFALSEGENATLDEWRTSHQAFFQRNGGFDPAMQLVCERFRILVDFG